MNINLSKLQSNLDMQTVNSLNTFGKSDKLDLIFRKQYMLQKTLGIFDQITYSKSLKQQYINQMILALHEEAVEIMRETAYKNPAYVPFGWKRNNEFNRFKMQDEIVDILHFVINLALVSGMDAELLYKKYCEKSDENNRRQKNGY